MLIAKRDLQQSTTTGTSACRHSLRARRAISLRHHSLSKNPDGMLVVAVEVSA